MKGTILFSGGSIIISFLLLHGCAKQPDTTALSADSVAIRFDVRGEREPALVFVHGWSNDRSLWDDQVAYFAGKYRVIAVDLPGFGESGNNRNSWTMEAFGNDVATVVRKLELDQVILVGFSMGGPVAIETAINIPDRVAGVVLVEGLHSVATRLPPAALHRMDSVYMDLVTHPAIEKLGLFFRTNREASFKRVLGMLRGGPREGWRESLHEAFRWRNDDCVGALKELRTPVVSINSDQTPTDVEGIQEHSPAYKAKIIHGVGHVVFWDDAEEFNRLLEESVREFVNKGLHD